MSACDTESQILRSRLRTLAVEARQNEQILQRFLERELVLLRIEGLGKLLTAFTEGLRTSFALQAVSLYLVDTDHRVRHLLGQTGLAPSMFPEVTFLSGPDELDPTFATLRRPRLGVYRQGLHRRLFAGCEDIRSVAILPMIRGTLVGHINLGSADPQRYTHRHASDFLHRLGVIGALCLESAVNRELLVINGHTDPLTGLRNRRYLELRLREELAATLRYRHPLSCLFIDVDHFKSVNDRFGHATGDAALRELGACLGAQLRTTDLATRYGGEEFAVLLPCTGQEEAVLLGQRICGETAQLRIAAEGGDFGITVSIGVSTFMPQEPDQGGCKVELDTLGRQLLAVADQALYRAKQQGRNRVVCEPSAAFGKAPSPAAPHAATRGHMPAGRT